MKRIAATALFATMALSSCGTTTNGNAELETRTVPNFSSVSLDGISTVRIHRGPQALRVTIDAGLLDHYETKVQGDTLRLGFKWGLDTWWALRKLKTCEVDITMPELRGIVVNGLGELTVDNFDYGKLDLQLNGAATIVLAGNADELSVSCTGSGKVFAKDLLTNKTVVSMTGAAHLELNVKTSLVASITGSGELVYRGNPQISQTISGAGRLRHEDD